MVELCLVTTHGCSLGFHSGHVSNKEFRHFLPYHASNQDIVHPLSFNLSLQQNDERRPTGGLLNYNHFITIDSTSKRPMLVDLQDSHSDSVLLSSGIADRCARHEKILKLLSSKSTDEQDHLRDLSKLFDLVGPQSRIADIPQQPFDSCSKWCFNNARTLQNLIHPTKELYFNEPFLKQLQRHCTDTEMNDVLSVVCGYYSSRNTNRSSRQTMLVPYFESRRRRARANTGASKLATTETSILKSLDKAKGNALQKKKTNAKTAKERAIYSNSYLHACESLLSAVASRKQQGKNVILFLKKSGPQLPQLLTQLSASIAGTGIAVVLSVLCRVACSRVPFCGSKFLTTGLGLGLVWLSWAVNKLRDTVILISKSSGKVGEKEEEMISDLERNLKDIYFRVAALMAVVVLKVA